MESQTEQIVEVVKTASLVNHLKANRLEYLLVCLLANTLGVFDSLGTQLNGVCF
jgi:hypothetical protein